MYAILKRPQLVEKYELGVQKTAHFVFMLPRTCTLICSRSAILCFVQSILHLVGLGSAATPFYHVFADISLKPIRDKLFPASSLSLLPCGSSHQVSSPRSWIRERAEPNWKITAFLAGPACIWYESVLDLLCCNNEILWTEWLRFEKHSWIFNAAGNYARIDTVPVLPGMIIVVYWRIFWALVNGRIVFSPPALPQSVLHKTERSLGDGGWVWSFFFYFLFSFFFFTLLLSRLWTRPCHRCVALFPPRFLPSIFIAHTGFSNTTARRFFVECCELTLSRCPQVNLSTRKSPNDFILVVCTGGSNSRHWPIPGSKITWYATGATSILSTGYHTNKRTHSKQ